MGTRYSAVASKLLTHPWDNHLHAHNIRTHTYVYVEKRSCFQSGRAALPPPLFFSIFLIDSRLLVEQPRERGEICALWLDEKGWGEGRDPSLWRGGKRLFIPKVVLGRMRRVFSVKARNLHSPLIR